MTTAENQDPATPPAPKRRRSGAELRDKITEAGGALRLVDTLYTRIENLEAQAASGATPAGAVVLTGDDAAAWRAYQALGTPTHLTTIIGERDQLQADIAARTASEARAKIAREGASALGWNVDAVTALAADKGLTLDMREVDVTVDGATVKKAVPHVVTGDTAEPFDVVAARDFAVYLPALTAGTTAQPSAKPAVPYPAQRPAHAAPPVSAVDAVLAKNAERAKAPNALRPAKAA